MESQNNPNPIQQIIIIQKTPEYTKRAIKKYYLKKKEVLITPCCLVDVHAP